MPYGSGINRNNNDDDRVRTGVKYIYTFQDTNTVRMTNIRLMQDRYNPIPLVKTPVKQQHCLFLHLFMPTINTE